MLLIFFFLIILKHTCKRSYILYNLNDDSNNKLSTNSKIPKAKHEFKVEYLHFTVFFSLNVSQLNN